MTSYFLPGLYREDVFSTPDPALLTGVPLFLGYAAQGPINQPQVISLWSQFENHFGHPNDVGHGYLPYAVRGFFKNGGLVCYVIRLERTADPHQALAGALAQAESLENVDLVCTPDLGQHPAGDPSQTEPPLDTVVAMQRAVLDHCQRLNDRFAILDAVHHQDIELVITQRNKVLASPYGALYYPWISVSSGGGTLVPPCGHIAGTYSRSDQRVGTHKAPANEVIEGIIDLSYHPTRVQQERLYQARINELRAMRGRGIRVWGSSTLSNDPAWRYINVSRLFITVGRWLERFMIGIPFEPHDFRLRLRIQREVNAYLDGLFQQGAFIGESPEQAFYVKCDADTNQSTIYDQGRIITEIGLVPAVPGEFVVARVIHDASGVNVTTDVL